MKFKEETIKEIANFLDSDTSVVLHKQTGEVIWYPEEALYDDPDGAFTELVEKTENNEDDYIQFFAKDSKHAYRVMEAFAANKVPDDFRAKIFQALDGAKPFKNFRILIDDSEYRQDWFDFRLECDMEMVRDRIEMDMQDD